MNMETINIQNLELVVSDFVRKVFIVKQRIANHDRNNFSGLTQQDMVLRTIHRQLNCKTGFGMGVLAYAPWCAFIGFGQAVQTGVYPVILYNTQTAVNNFEICYGVGAYDRNLNGVNWPSEIVASLPRSRTRNYSDSYVVRAFSINSESDFDANRDEIIRVLSQVIENFLNMFRVGEPVLNINNRETDVASRVNPVVHSGDITPLNQILYGAPGTGKTYHTVIKALQIVAGGVPDTDHARMREFEKYRSMGQIQFVTFHQSMAYEEFVQGIKPVIANDASDAGKIQYECADGIFKKIANIAGANKDKKYVLIIDEINRGNISKIFGELITLLEPDKRIGRAGELKLTLPYSGDDFGVPENLYVIGTMNTSDRSIAAVDIALRRRFTFIPMRPDASLIGDVVDGINLRRVFENINRKIEILLDEDHMIGHSYFMKCANLADIKHMWFNAVMPLMNEYFYGDWEKLRLVLGPDFVTEISVPDELSDYCNGDSFYRFARMSDFSDDGFKVSLNKLG